MLIDSHAHLDMQDFEGDREQVLARALEGGITHIIAIGIDLSSSLKSLELAGKYDFVFSTLGYHPHNAKAMDTHILKELVQLAEEPKVVAWGEIGLDFYRRRSPPPTQMAVFEQQLDIASNLNLPVIVHSRDAHNEVFEILNKRKGDPQGVIHCFSGDLDLALAFVEMGYYISIPGTVTYKNASNVQEVASKIPLERLLLETDAPFLAPIPKRGKRNEPLFIIHTAQKIAQLRDMDFQEVSLQTSENTKRLFRLPTVT
jgi:TatD DNase family protein